LTMNKKFKNKKLWIFLGIIGILVIAAFFKSRDGGREKSVTIEQAEKRTITETVSANGKVQPVTEVKISSDVSGEIVELLVKEGDVVLKGDLLAKINRDIYLSNVERMVAALNTSKANYANSKARVSQSKAQFINADASFKRNDRLFKDGAISQSEFDAALSAFEVARAEVEASEQGVIAAEFNVKSAEASVKEANDNLIRTNIYAPVGGTISMLNVSKGERVVGTLQMAGTEMLRIANLDEMEVKVDVNENDIVRISLGDTALVEVDAYKNRKFKGLVTQIANSAKVLGVNADQVTNFEVKVRILSSSYADLINPLKPHLSPFRPGMSATVEIQTKTARNVVSVPIQSVSTRQDTEATNAAKLTADKNEKPEPVMNECVFIYKDGKAELRQVKTGVQDSKFIEIISGLDGTEKVITGPYYVVSKDLKNNDAVIVNESGTFGDL
jgi:HlyD family secretion protein